VGISGYCLDPAAIARDATDHARDTPWLVTHGTRDDVLPFHRSERQVVELQLSARLPIEWHAFEKEHTIDPTEEIAMLRHWIAARME
jgi:predicted esterase